MAASTVLQASDEEPALSEAETAEPETADKMATSTVLQASEDQPALSEAEPTDTVKMAASTAQLPLAEPQPTPAAQVSSLAIPDSNAGKIAASTVLQASEDQPALQEPPDAVKFAASTAQQPLAEPQPTPAAVVSSSAIPARNGEIAASTSQSLEPNVTPPAPSSANAADIGFVAENAFKEETIKPVNCKLASTSQLTPDAKSAPDLTDTASENAAAMPAEALEESISEHLSTTASTLPMTDNDVFEDAENETLTEFIDLQTSFEDCNQAMVKFFDNDIEGAMAIMKPWSNVSLYHSLGVSIFEFIPAMLTFDKDQMQQAVRAIKNCIRICNYTRRQFTFTENLGAIIKKPKYALCTDLEAHSELCYAEALLLQAALTIIEGEDYSSYLRGTLKIKACYDTYKICWDIKERKIWDTEQSKIHFDSGVRLGTATFNLMVSLLPSKIISLLEFVGFSGSKSYGLNELSKGANLPGMRAVLCDLTLLIYHLIICPFIGGEGNIEAAELIFQKVLVTYPNSVWFLALRARSEFLKARLRHSISAYNRATIGQQNFKQFRILCYWELMWVHGLNLEFLDAAMYAERLVIENAWSKTTHLYIKAAMLMHIDPCEVTASQLKNIENAILLAPRYKVRVAGKSLPMEKFVIRRCERFIRQKRLILPAFELFCVWNLFQILTRDKDHLFMILRTIEKTREAVEKEDREWMGEYVSDNLALIYFIQGCALTAMELPRQALQVLQKVMDLKRTIKEDTFLIPYTICEMAMCYYEMGDMQTSLELLNDAKKRYSGYNLETRLHFRVHARVQIVRSVIGASEFKPGAPGIKVKKYFDG